MTVPKMSVIADCNADSVIIRCPQELAIKMVKSVIDTDDGKELLEKMKRCNSKKVYNLLKENKVIPIDQPNT